MLTHHFLAFKKSSIFTRLHVHSDGIENPPEKRKNQKNLIFRLSRLYRIQPRPQNPCFSAPFRYIPIYPPKPPQNRSLGPHNRPRNPSNPPFATRVSRSGPEPCPSGSPLAVDIISLLRAPLRHRSERRADSFALFFWDSCRIYGEFSAPPKIREKSAKKVPPRVIPPKPGYTPQNRGVHRSDVQTTPTTSKQ